MRTCASQNQFTVIQPGSTVATSLVEGEAKPKHVALLSIKDDNWKMESIPLTTVRPFLLREVVLAEREIEALHAGDSTALVASRQACPICHRECKGRHRLGLYWRKFGYAGPEYCA